MFNIEYSSQSKNFLKKAEKQLSERIIKKLERLIDNPIPSDSKFIGRDEEGEAIFRYRIGDYRILYKLKHSQNIILITKIDKRSLIY
ncbi:MAG: type II toxin-antitoxin system RelE/ParE family toxin [Candidatus Woesearchaeota archaeon]|nr:MAG: type II toxin-antitoxin system RelE/ParE family toxin [Candidatus Woesearchaeota archaeon]